jgi:hypothetical protein
MVKEQESFLDKAAKFLHLGWGCSFQLSYHNLDTLLVNLMWNWAHIPLNIMFFAPMATLYLYSILS